MSESNVLLDIASELAELNDDNLAQRVLDDNDVQWCLSELVRILNTSGDCISRSALLAVVKDVPTWIDDDGYFMYEFKYPDGMFEPEDIVSSIENAPSVDVVPVGRCRDCAKYHAEIAWCDEWSCFEKDGEPCDPADSMQWRELEPEEYCSRFEKKEKAI